MVHKLLLAIFLASAVASSSTHGSSDVLGADIQLDTLQNSTEFARINPEAKLLTAVATEPQPYPAFDYTLGSRVNGDSLKATKIDWFTYASPQDVKLTLNYPDSGTGAVVTFVNITVEQSTNDGKAYIVDGGIGQRKINVIVEASNTLYFRYKAYIYGY